MKCAVCACEVVSSIFGLYKTGSAMERKSFERATIKARNSYLRVIQGVNGVSL